MMKALLATLSGLALAWTVAPTAAHAKPKPTSKTPAKTPAKAPKKQDAEPTPEQAQADRHFKNGVALFVEAKYTEALAEFERAYEISPHPLVLYNIAGCHRELSNYAEAVKLYRRFLAEGKGQVPAARLTTAQVELDGILARIARVTVTASPDGAELFIDGQSLGTLVEMPLIVSPGEHRLAAKAPGYQDGTRVVRVASGDELAVELNLIAAPVEPATNLLDVANRPDRAPAAAAPATSTAPRRFAIGAAFGTNLRDVAESGAPTIGVGVALGSRVVLGVDAVVVAYAVMPSVRIRLAGDALAVHAIGAVPIAFPDRPMADAFVAGAAGLGVRYRATPSFALRLESLASFAAAPHGTTFPTFLGGELWF